MSALARLERAWSLGPLALALAALAALDGRTAAPSAPCAPAEAATPFSPPVLMLASAHVREDERYAVVASKSRALASVPGRPGLEREFALGGRLELSETEGLARLDLELTPGGSGRHERPVALRAVASASRHSSVPGLHVLELPVSVVEGGAARSITLSVSWLRLPGGRLALQAVSQPSDDCGLTRAPASAPWERAPRAALSLNVEFTLERADR